MYVQCVTMTTNDYIVEEEIRIQARISIHIYYIPFYIKNSKIYIYMYQVGLKNRDRIRVPLVQGEEFSWGPLVAYSRIGGCRSITFWRPNGRKK